MFYRNDYDVISMSQEVTENGEELKRIDIRLTSVRNTNLECLLELREKIDNQIFMERMRMYEMSGEMCDTVGE